THAFFKSLLFLGAGAVIHYVHSNDMLDMGGLRKHMPVTHATFLLACLAIAGVPPLSGFFSKEEILLAAYEGNKAIYFIALFTAGLTAFYMFRLYFMIFWQKEKHYDAHHGEGPMSMKLPLIVLSLLTIVTGFIPFAQYVSSNGKGFDTHLHLMFSIAPVAMVIIGIGVAYVLYQKANDKPASLANTMGGLYHAAYRKFYIDELYLFITHKIIFRFIGKPAAWTDKNIVDGTVNTVASATDDVSFMIKGWQSGKVQQYAMYFFAGALLLAFIFIYLWH
ncbi:MAG: NADH-quinone oxidoreductase subunit L, partial [Chitinophagaceae bacterium]|nr:NADH-quinone oxidoreductase subunit L [Chitinophagaceae bacterium]